MFKKFYKTLVLFLSLKLKYNFNNSNYVNSIFYVNVIMVIVKHDFKDMRPTVTYRLNKQ